MCILYLAVLRWTSVVTGKYAIYASIILSFTPLILNRLAVELFHSRSKHSPRIKLLPQLSSHFYDTVAQFSRKPTFKVLRSRRSCRNALDGVLLSAISRHSRRVVDNIRQCREIQSIFPSHVHTLTHSNHVYRRKIVVDLLRSQASTGFSTVVDVVRVSHKAEDRMYDFENCRRASNHKCQRSGCCASLAARDWRIGKDAETRFADLSRDILRRGDIYC